MLLGGYLKVTKFPKEVIKAESLSSVCCLHLDLESLNLDSLLVALDCLFCFGTYAIEKAMHN